MLIGVACAVSAMLLRALGGTINITSGEVVAHRVTVADPRIILAGLFKSQVSAALTSVATTCAGMGMVSVTFLVDDDVTVRDCVIGGAIGAWMGMLAPLFYSANHVSRSDTINSLYCLAPVGALAWLSEFTEVTISDPALFWVGASGVIAVNVLLHLRPVWVKHRRMLMRG